MRVAAVQMKPTIGAVSSNLEQAGQLVRAAAAAGAELVALPEFFTTAAAFVPALADVALAPDGAATLFLQDRARAEAIYLGGSFLCRDQDGEVRNAYFLAGPDGQLLGRHDKDLPTMWENALYIGGADDGVIEADGLTFGAAVCWEFMRSQTARRLRGRVDLIIGGSNWWTIPAWPPRPLMRHLERANSRTAHKAPSVFGRYVGAPVVHAANSGEFSCPMPDMPPLRYHGAFEGGALIADATGQVLAHAAPQEGATFVIAEIEPRRQPPVEPVPDRYWLHKRGALSTYAWHSQRVHGRVWYRRHVRGRPPFEVADDKVSGSVP